MDKAEKQAIMSEYRSHENDTGSTELQVAVLTARITGQLNPASQSP